MGVILSLYCSDYISTEGGKHRLNAMNYVRVMTLMSYIEDYTVQKALAKYNSEGVTIFCGTMRRVYNIRVSIMNYWDV